MFYLVRSLMPKRLTINQVKQVFSDNGCELLSAEYASNSQPLLFVCKCGKQAITTLQRFKKGSLCKECGYKSARKNKLGYTIDFVKEEFRRRGMVCLETEYINNYTPMRYICCCGNESMIRFFCLLKGQKCVNCGVASGQKHYGWIEDREEALLRKKFRSRQKHLVRSVLCSLGISKRFKSSEILGYTSIDLMNHIRSFPEWFEISSGKWHIDHIYPIKAFLDHGITDVKIINCLDNLQPLSAGENLSKNARYDKDKFLEWLGKKK